ALAWFRRWSVMACGTVSHGRRSPCLSFFISCSCGGENRADPFRKTLWRTRMRLPHLSTSDWFLKAIVLCYEQPAAALEQMEKFSEQRGRAALLKKLAGQPGYFGWCSFSSKIVPGRSSEVQRGARSAAALLPLLAMEAIEAPPAAQRDRRKARRRAGKGRRVSLAARMELARHA